MFLGPLADNAKYLGGGRIRVLNVPHENVPGPFDGEKGISRQEPVTKRCAVS
jgi:hypothetical protein